MLFTQPETGSVQICYGKSLNFKIHYLAEVGYDPEFGARPVKRAIQRYVLNDLSKSLLSGSVNSEKPVIIDCFGDGLVFRNK